MAAGSSPPLQCLLALIILVLQWPEGADTFQSVPLVHLFANAIIRTDHLFTLAAATYSLFNCTYISDNQRNPMQPVNCFSQSIQEPVGKKEIRQTSDTDLLRISLAFIQLWFGSTRSFRSRDEVYLSFNRVYAQLGDLAKGIHVIMQELGAGGSDDLETIMSGYENFEVALVDEDATMKNFNLLSCFKNDMHKVETYLRVVCRRSRQFACRI